METKARKLERENVVLDVIPPATHPTKTTKYVNRFVVLALIIVAISLGIFLKWSFEGTDVLKVNNSPFPTKIVQQDGSGIVVLTADYCKNQKLDGTLRISFVSQSREIFLPIAQEELQRGCGIREIPIIIPKDLIPDTYKIKFRAIYDVNPVRQNIIVEFESKSFEIK